MTEFVASNGIVVNRYGDGSIGWKERAKNTSGVLLSGVDAEKGEAIREFFQAERDAELGRWRWPKNPYYVVYPRVSGMVRVVEEFTGRSAVFARDDDFTCIAWAQYGDAARAYFEAHPERKPWHDAKPGEVWLIKLDGSGEEIAVVVDGSGEFQGSVVRSPESASITAGRRIWPEGSGNG